MKDYVIRLIKGVIIALGFILPGVSGGVLAAILGLYERLIYFLAHIRENFRSQFLYFLPVGIGGILGIGLFSKPLEWLLLHYQVIVLWAFAGAIIGSIPALWQEAETKTRRDQKDWLILGATLIGSMAFFVALNNWAVQVPATFIGFVLAGALIALGVLVPGLSPSNLLLVLGLYQPMLVGFKQFDLLGVYLPMAIGGVLALAIFAKSMDRLLQTAHARVYHFIIGVVLASTAMIVLPPIIDYSGVTLLTVGLAVLGFGLGLWLGAWMSQLEKRYKA